MKKVLRCKQLALFLAMLMVVLAPMTIHAAPPPTTTGVTQDNFDAKRYADTYADLKKAFGYNEAQLWQHYLTFGIKEGRTVFVKGSSAPATATTGITQANFDAKRYADTYADLKKAFGYNEAQLWQHYQQYGIKEGRQVFAKGAATAPVAVQAAAPAPAATVTTPAATVNGLTQATFDARRYADTYADLKKAFGYDEAKLWQHYTTFGVKEGRQAFAKGAAAPVTAVKATAPVATAAAPTASGNFLSKEGGVQIAEYARSIGAYEHVNQLIILSDPGAGGGWAVSLSLPAGWKTNFVTFSLWSDHWLCRARNSSMQPPIAEIKARTLAEAQAFLDRYKP